MERRWRSGRLLGWFALALLGLVVAAAVSLAASRLSSQHIGLSSEPLGAGKGLAPVVQATTRTTSTTRTSTSTRHRGKHRTTTTVQTMTLVVPRPTARSPAPAPAKPAPRHGDDSGGSRHGGGDD
jgi:hypothetical protein